MITKTTLSAIRALQHLGRETPGQRVSLRAMANHLGESPTYMAKVARGLVKTGILRAEKGALGGVRLGRVPGQITLLDIVEACQGKISVDHCRSDCATGKVCAYHRAAVELRTSILGVLSHWTLAQLLSEAESQDSARIAECMVASRAVTLAPVAGGPR